MKPKKNSNYWKYERQIDSATWRAILSSTTQLLQAANDDDILYLLTQDFLSVSCKVKGIFELTVKRHGDLRFKHPFDGANIVVVSILQAVRNHSNGAISIHWDRVEEEVLMRQLSIMAEKRTT